MPHATARSPCGRRSPSARTGRRRATCRSAASSRRGPDGSASRRSAMTVLKIAGLSLIGIGCNPADEARAAASPYTGWAGFNYDAFLPRDKAKGRCCSPCAANAHPPGRARRHVAHHAGPLRGGGTAEIPIKGRRWVLGHIVTLSPRDIERIARMGIVLTPHTNRYIYIAKVTMLQQRLPPQRHREITPLRDLSRCHRRQCRGSRPTTSRCRCSGPYGRQWRASAATPT